MEKTASRGGFPSRCGFKFGFVGERESGLRRLKPFLKEGFKNPKNFQKVMIK